MTKDRVKKFWDFLSVFFCVFGGYMRYSNISSMILKKSIAWGSVAIGMVMLSVSLLVKFIKKEYSLKQLIIGASIGILGIFVFQRRVEMYVALLLCFNYFNGDLRNLIKYIFISSLISFTSIVLLSLIGIIPNKLFFRKDIERYTLGFSHPNVCLRFYLPVIMSGAITLKNNRLFLLFCASVSIVLYAYTNSRAGLIITMLFILLSLPCLFLIMTFLSIISGIYFGDNLAINDALSNRANLFGIFSKNIGFFGKRVNDIGLPLDNVFIYILYCGGIYGFAFYTILYFISFFNNENKGNYNLFIIFFVMLVYGYVENCSALGESFILPILFIQLFNKEKVKELDDDYGVEQINSIKIDEIKEVA